MEKLTADWQRLSKVIEWSGLNINAFATRLGFKRSENLYQIKKGNHGISKALAGTIVKHFPQINYTWLLTGEGEMMDGENPAGNRRNAVPEEEIEFRIRLTTEQVKKIYDLIKERK